MVVSSPLVNVSVVLSLSDIVCSRSLSVNTSVELTSVTPEVSDVESEDVSVVVLEDESDENDNTEVLLSYDRFEAPAGKIMQISQDFSAFSESEENTNQDVDIDDNSEENLTEAENEPEIQETSAQQISQDMEKEFGEMRMIQLANSIAGDLGMITKVTLVG